MATSALVIEKICEVAYTARQAIKTWQKNFVCNNGFITYRDWLHAWRVFSPGWVSSRFPGLKFQPGLRIKSY
jgi:hypothetical protein